MMSKDTTAGIVLSFVIGIAVWAGLEGHLTPSLAADLLDIGADAVAELSN
jgi:hypothetical protein